VKRFIIILDSCRYDTYAQADLPRLKKMLGDPEERWSNANATYRSACGMLGVGHFPYLPFEQTYRTNNVRLWRKEFDHMFFYGDIPYLHPAIIPMNEFSSYFDEWHVPIRDCRMNNTDKLVEMCREHTEKDYLMFLWLNNTHTPYWIDGKPSRNYTKNEAYLSDFNRLPGTPINDKIFVNIHNDQIKALECLDDQLADLIEDLSPVDVTITADHGESFGEEHHFGHGNNIHWSQFKVPFVRRWVE